MTRTLPITVSLVAVFLGCAGELEDPQRFATGIACQDPVAFVRESCGLSGCHVAGNLLNTVDLVSPGVAARLLDQDPLMCEGELLVDSNDPSNSFILDKLSANPVCGVQMPFLRAPLSAAERACVARYVEMVIDGTVELGPTDAATADTSTP